MRKKRIRFAGLVLTAFALAAVMTAAACAEAEPQKQNDDGRGYAAAGVEEQADETKNKNADMEEAANRPLFLRASYSPLPRSEAKKAGSEETGMWAIFFIAFLLSAEESPSLFTEGLMYGLGM